MPNVFLKTALVPYESVDIKFIAIRADLGGKLYIIKSLPPFFEKS